MMLCIVKKKLSLLYPKNAVHFPFSSAAAEIKNPSPKSKLIAEFLMSSCGFSPQKAASASKAIFKSTSVEQADSVRHFFKHHGFDDTRICQMISKYPNILSTNVEKTIQPNVQALSDLGFADAELQVLVTSNPRVVTNPSAIPRLEFWETFLRTTTKKDLVKIFARNRGLLDYNIVSGISPKIALLKKHGLSDADIIILVKRGHSLMLRSCKTIEAYLKRIKEIGFDTKSSLMIVHGLSSLSRIGKSSFARKMELFKGFGWSEQEFLGAFRKVPAIITLKDESIGEKIEFLVGRAGCKQSYIASHPLLLAFSLEKRLKPRHHVLEILKASKVVERELDILTIMCLVDKKFVEKHIVPYKDRLPELHEIYTASCAGQFSFG